MNIAPDGLCVEKVHVWRGDRHVLKGVSLEVGPGDLVHVVGPERRRQDHLLRVATGLLRPGTGRRAVARHADSASSASRLSGELAYASHEPALKSDLTALENLRFMVGLKRRATVARTYARVWNAPASAVCADLPARVLSAGQRRRVAMARVLALRARLWLLDEPFTNLDAAGSSLLSELLDRTCRARRPGAGRRASRSRCRRRHAPPGAAGMSVGRRAGLGADVAARTASEFPAPGSAPAAAGVLLDRHDAVSVGAESAAVAVARHGARVCFGWPRCYRRCCRWMRCSRRRRGWNPGAIGAVGTGLARDRGGQDAGALAGERRGTGGGFAAWSPRRWPFRLRHLQP